MHLLIVLVLSSIRAKESILVLDQDLNGLYDIPDDFHVDNLIIEKFDLETKSERFGLSVESMVQNVKDKNADNWP